MAFDGTLKFDTKIDEGGFHLGIGNLGSIAKKGMALVTGAITAATGAISALGAKAIDVGKGFEKSMAQVIATMGITKDTIEDGVNSYDLLKEAAAAAGESTTFSASEAADALNYLALAGYSAAQASEALPAVLDLAAAGGLDLAYASDLATDAMAALGIEATKDNLTRFGDEMAKTASKANTSVAQLGEAILTVGGTAKSLAGGTTELNAALGVLANRGIKGSEGGTALRNMILSLSAPTDKAAAQMEALGLEVFDAAGNMRPLNEVFKDLDKSLSTMTEGEKTQVLNSIFNKVDLKSAQAMLAGCGDEFDALANAIEGAWYSADSLDAALADLSGSNANVSLKALQSQFESLGIDAEGFDYALSASKGNAKDFADTLFEISKHGTSYDDILNTLGVSVDDLQTAFDNTNGAMSQMAETMNDTLEGDMKSLGSKAEALGIAVYESLNEPLRELAQLGGAYISQLTAAFKEGGFEGLAESLGNVLGQAVTQLASYVPKISKIAVSLVQSLVKGLTSNAPAIAKAALSAGMTLLEGIFSISADLLELGASLLVTLAEGIQERLPEISETARTIIEQTADTLSENLPLILSAGASIIGSLVSVITENLPLIVESAVQIIAALCDELLTGENLQKLLDAGMQLLMSITQAIVDNLPLLIDIAIQILTFLCTELLSADNITKLLDAAFQIITALTDAIIDNIDTILLAVEEIIRTLCSELLSTDNLEKLLSTGAEMLGELIVGLCQIAGKLLGFAVDLYEELSQTLSDIDWGALGIAIVEGICSGLLDCDFVLSDFLDDFGDNWLSGIKDIFGIHSPSKVMHDEVGEYLALGIGEGFADTAAQIGQGITQTVSGWTDQLAKAAQQAAQTTVQGAKSLYDRIPDSIRQPLNTALNNTAQWGADLVESGREAASGFLDDILNFVKQLPDLSQQPLSETISRVISWGTSLAERGREAAQSLVSTITDTISSLPSMMADVGRNLVSGLWNGIAGMGSWLKSQISGFADGIISGFKETFGIASPSKVMRDSVGRYLAEGIGVGFADTIPQVGKDALRAFEDITLPDFRFKADLPDDGNMPHFPRPDSSALQAFRDQNTALMTGLAYPGATSQIVNNSYYYNTTNQTPSGEPVQPVVNVRAVIQVGDDTTIEKLAEKVDVIQGETIEFDERGTAH